MQGYSDLDMEKTRLFHRLSQRISDERVIEAMESVPREMFVPAASYNSAYEDIPLSIQEGQTISQPFIVAIMTKALELTGNERVLEIGTGSGYQAAILAQIAKQVISVERHKVLIDFARRIINDLGCTNVEIYPAEETLGWRAGSPYDRIIVTAAAPDVPQVLLDQLAPGGRLVIPVGKRDEQELLKITKEKWGISTHELGGCRFVPLIGEGAWVGEE